MRLKRTIRYGTALGLTLTAGYTSVASAQDSATTSQPSQASETGQSARGLQDIVVTARRREERLQDVPVAVSVISPGTIEARGTYNPVDIAKSTPGLNVTASIGDRNNLTYSIRGQGFSFGTVFPAVITYFNEVPITRLTQGQFFDIENIQVLRGPQGVNFGRVTDGGNVMVAAQKPKERFGGYIGTKLGSSDLYSFEGALNIPVVADKILMRGAFEVARRDGFTKNLLGPARDDVAYEGYRFGLTLRPTDMIENSTTVSFQRTHDNGTGVVFSGFNPSASGLLPQIQNFSGLFAGGYGLDANGSVVPLQTLNQAGFTPLTRANFLTSQQAQLAAQQARGIRTISAADPTFSRRKNLYVINSTSIELSDNVELKNIFGYVLEKEDRSASFSASNGAITVLCGSSCFNTPDLLYTNREQFSEELRLSGKAFGGDLTWAVGGYLDEQKPAGPSESASISVGILNRANVIDITTKSRALYGSLEYALTDNLSLIAGLRYTHDTVHSEQTTYLSPLDGPAPRQALFNFLTSPAGGSRSPAVANQVVAATFAPIPHGECLTYGAGSVFYSAGASDCIVRDASFNATTWQIGANYRTDSGQLFYLKASKGYRPGGVNGTAPPGVDPSYNPETDLSIEAGLKADFRFNDTFLRTNLAFYSDRFKKIQKTVVLPGPVPVSLIQNVNNARIKGIEGEITLIPSDGLTIGGNFAYTDAKFDRHTPAAVGNPCDPTQTTTIGFCSDNRFNSVPEWQFALNVDYRLPIDESLGQIGFGGTLFHQSSVALTDTSVLNPQSIEPGYTTIDGNIYWRNIGGHPIDLGFFVTNLTNKTYRIGANNLLHNASIGTLGNIYAPPRMWGVSLKYRWGDDAD